VEDPHTLRQKAPDSLAGKLADFFHRRPNCWVDGKTLSLIAGQYAWRTRCSDLRRAPFNMVIENRQRHVAVGGETFTISEYRFVVQDVQTGEGAADDAPTSPAAASRTTTGSTTARPTRRF
jgi:hypothetical protein